MTVPSACVRAALRPLLMSAVLLAACGGGDPPPARDAGRDAGQDAGAPRDAGRDAGPGIDAGPPVTGCELLDGAVPGVRDGGLPDPGAFVPAVGPGGPRQSYAEAELGEHCAYLPLGPMDENHHNTAFMLDGYLVRAWAHERGRGGIAVWDFDEPCAPELIANVLDEQIRETHATGYSTVNGRHLAVASLTGVEFWDVADITAPVRVTDMLLPGVRYPDSYMRVVMSVSWQAPYLYVGGSDNGIYIVDATDPSAPVLVRQYVPEPFFRVGPVSAIGTLLVAMSSEGSVVSLFDISDPGSPRPIAGGTYEVSNGMTDRFGRPYGVGAYFGTVNGYRSYHARGGIFGGGLAIMDIRDFGRPAFLGNVDAPSSNGGYVYLQHETAFIGLSNYGASYDLADPSAPAMIRRYEQVGDVDTLTPIGNVVVVSVDDDAIPGQASAVVPHQRDPDMRPPVVNMVVPVDGASEVALSARVGLTFDEFVAMESIWEGSVVVRPVGEEAPIEGWFSGQEGVVNFWPAQPLMPATEYEVLVRPGGVHDVSGNALETEFRSTFTTVDCGG